MNTSQNTDLLSAEQLEGYLQNSLPAEEMKRVQHLLDDCELSREALEGYSIVPGAFADVEGLKKAIAVKSGMTMNWGTISLSVLAIAIVSVLITIFYPTNEQEVVTEPQSETQNYTLTIPAPENVLSPNEDHFVNPEALVVTVTIPNNIIAPNDTGKKENIVTEVLQPLRVDEKQNPIVDSVPVELKKKEITYNASVGFIVDLKVTEYDKYYAAPVEVKELPMGGTPAKYETEDGLGDSKEEKDEEVVRIVPADQFLREGLIAFRDGRYGKCISKMEILLEHNPDDINALFYTAVSYVKLEMYSKAIPLLDKIILAENNVFDEEAEWYKAIALEGNGDSAAADELFKKISSGGGFYAEQASRKLR